MRTANVRRPRARALLIAAAVGASGIAAHAQAPAGAPLPPERQASGGVAFVSGGIDEGQSKRFLAAFDRYPLAVQLFERVGSGNAYTADAVVRIVDAQGQVVLEQKSDGPFMLVRLPAGSYRVGASLDGRTLPEQQVQVTATGHAKATFLFSKGAG